ncbi:PTAC2 [Symbiodinium pilosum]|uniref:PTAC2 protein n=1 Tax=Symbiodinium pilosum TaxID=2952 RepID=A0A812UAQ5_SYMPI|nr:PTAC2 [Symbiodinium pilosum]
MAEIPASTELHPAAQVQKWKLNLRGWLWNPQTQPREADRICQALLQSGHLETLPEYSDILAAVGARRCWQAGLEIWTLLVQGPQQIRPDVKALNTALRVLGNAAQWELALSMLASASSCRLQLNMESIQHTMSGLGESHQWQRALTLLAESHQQQSAPSVACCSEAIKALSAAGEHRFALWMLYDSESIQLRPDERTYAAAILSCGGLGEWQRALAYLDYIPQIGLTPTAFCVVNAMQACAACGQWDRVLDLFDGMQESKLSRPVKAFSTSLEACQATGDWEKALAIFDEFISKGGVLEEDLVEPLVTACLAAQKQEQVRQFLIEWDKLGFLPSYALSRYVADHS